MNNPCAYYDTYWWKPGILIRIEREKFRDDSYLVFRVADNTTGQVKEVEQEDVSVFRTDKKAVLFCNQMNAEIETARAEEEIKVPQNRPHFSWSD